MKTAKDTVMNDEQMFRLLASPEGLELLKQFKKASVSGEYHRLVQVQADITWDITIKEVVELAIESDVLCSEKQANENDCVACKVFYAKLKESDK